MKKFVLIAAMTLSAQAFANLCEVDMVDTSRYSRPVLTTFRSSDGVDGCFSAMKQCRLEIRKRNLEQRADCVKSRFENPIPQPRPEPRPYPSSDAQRSVSINENVIVNNKYQTVIGYGVNNDFTVRSNDSWGTITRTVHRENISVTSGCNLGLCVNDSVINTISGNRLAVAGLSYDNTFVTTTSDSWRTITSRNHRENLAETRGCVSARYVNLCVGDMVLNTFNREATVIGIQYNGMVVIETRDTWKMITTNVDPTTLVVIR